MVYIYNSMEKSAHEYEEEYEEEYEDDFEEECEEEEYETDIEISVRTLVSMKQNLDRIIGTAEQLHNVEFYEIYDNITKYIQLYCNHNYVLDLVDITPERSQTICYCTNCEQLKPEH